MRRTLNTFKITSFGRRIVAYICLLLFIYLSRIDDFFDCALGYETVDLDVSTLADSEGSVLRLEIMCWIPIWVE